MKFSLKNLTKGTQKNAITVATIGAGVIASRKVIDLEKLLDNFKVAPDSYVRKNSGLVKVGMGVLGANLFAGPKQQILQNLMIGVAIDGALLFLEQAQDNNNSGGGSGDNNAGDAALNEQPAEMSDMIDEGVAGPGENESSVAGDYVEYEEMAA